MDRKALRGTLAMVGLGAVMGLGFVAACGGGDDDETTDTTTKRSKPEATTSTTAPPENPIKVVDQGFSNFTSEGSPKAAYGYIVQNTGTKIVRDIDVEITLYAAGDKVIFEGDATIEMLRPGEKTGQGDSVLGDIQGGPAERVEVVIPYLEEPVADPSTIPDGAFQAGDIRTTANSLFLETTFTFSTTYALDRIGIPVAYAIYRDSAGKIVGGASGTGLIGPGGVVVSPAKVSSYGIFPGVASTEIYFEPSVIVPDP